MTNVIDQRAEPDGSVGASRFPARSPDHRGGLPAGGSTRAVPGAGPAAICLCTGFASSRSRQKSYGLRDATEYRAVITR